MPVTRRVTALRRLDFLFKYGFGIILLLNCAKCADVAQSAEHPPCKRAVTSSILVVGFTSGNQKVNNPVPGGYPSGQRGLTVNQLSEDFGGSNPSPPTIPRMRDSTNRAHIAQSVEHTLGKGEVTGPNPVVGSVAEKFYVCEKEKETWRRQSMTGASRI